MTPVQLQRPKRNPLAGRAVAHLTNGYPRSNDVDLAGALS